MLFISATRFPMSLAEVALNLYQHHLVLCFDKDSNIGSAQIHATYLSPPSKTVARQNKSKTGVF